MKTPEERQCFLMSLSMSMTFWWIQLYLTLVPHISFHDHFTWYTVRYKIRQTHVPANGTTRTKSRGAQRSPEFAFRSMDFSVPENLIFPVLVYGTEFIPEGWYKNHSKESAPSSSQMQ